MSSRHTFRQIIDRHPQGLQIAPYQRHYVWGQHRDGEKDSVAYLTECLVEAYQDDTPYFLQGITIKDDKLVDGQQRLTYLTLLLGYLGYDSTFSLRYANREAADQWLNNKENWEDISENPDEESQDVYFFKRTLRHIKEALIGIDHESFLAFILDKVEMLYIDIPEETSEIAIYKMMNGTKARMLSSDIIKADIMRLASDPAQPNSHEWELASLRQRYANEWDTWLRWWGRADVKQYFSMLAEPGIDLLLKLSLREQRDDFTPEISYAELNEYIRRQTAQPYHSAKHLFHKMRGIQHRIEEAYDDATTYNRIKAIMLLQQRRYTYIFLHKYFVESTISPEELERYYKLSFLGMNIDEISRNEPYAERFDDLMASLSMADVYHSDTKRDVFNLLLRLNIDEDIKLGRKFDFSVWNNRSLEHILPKSKVWHIGRLGRVVDGNDNSIRGQRRDIMKDKQYTARDWIVNCDGTHLSEHCLGNLVLLYGENNSTFGNSSFERKKLMFLTPGDSTVFQSRNLLHTVCVFAANEWDHRSIVENYNRTLKNLKLYYGCK